jgi:hypothetical protein
MSLERADPQGLGQPQLPSLERLDWDDLPAVSAACADAFALLTARNWALLSTLLEHLPQRPDLTAMCESYDFLDKLVLHDAPAAGYRVRLHRFRPGYFDRPHNHRWTFGSMILTGAYRHVQYGDDSAFEDAGMRDLSPLQIRTERAGDFYVLHHRAVHSVTAQDGTLSLVLRGPAAKDRFRILDAVSGDSFHVSGAKDETAAQRQAKRMSADRLDQTVRDVIALRPAGIGRGSSSVSAQRD